MSCHKCGKSKDLKIVELVTVWGKRIPVVFMCTVCLSAGVSHRLEGIMSYPEIPHETTRPASTYTTHMGGLLGATTSTVVSGDQAVRPIS